MSDAPLRYQPTLKENPEGKRLYIKPGHARLFERVDDHGAGCLLIAYSKRKAHRIGFNTPKNIEEATEDVYPVVELVINNVESVDVYIQALQKLKDMMLAKQKEEPHDTQTNQG